MRFTFVVGIALIAGMVLVAAINTLCLVPARRRTRGHINSPWPGGLSGN